MAEAEQRRGEQLQAAEPAVNFERALTANDPTGEDGQEDGENHANYGRQKDKSDRFDPAMEDEGFETGSGDGGATITANESVGRAGGEAENEGDQVPGNRAKQTGEKDLLIDKLDVNHAFADGAGDGSTEDESGDEIPESGPGDGTEGREHTGGNDGGDGIGGVVPAVREFEGQGKEDDDEEEGEASHEVPCAGLIPREIPRLHSPAIFRPGRNLRSQEQNGKKKLDCSVRDDRRSLSGEMLQQEALAESGALEDDAFDDVGDVFTLVDGGFDDLKDLFPLDDLDGIFFLVEELGDQRATQAVAIVFIAVDFDTVFEGLLGSLEGADGQFDFRSGGNQDLDEVYCSGAYGVHAIEHKAAGGRVDQIDHVVKATTEPVNVLTVKRGDEGLIELGEKGVGKLVAFMLDGLDDLHLFRHAGVVREHFQQGIGPHMDIRCLFGEEVKETLFPRQEPLQKSWHGVDSPLKSRVRRHDDSRGTQDTATNL